MPSPVIGVDILAHRFFMLALPIDALDAPIFKTKKLRQRREATAACSYTRDVTNESLLNRSRTREANHLLIFERGVTPFWVQRGVGERATGSR